MEGRLDAQTPRLRSWPGRAPGGVQTVPEGGLPGDLEIILQSNGGGRPASFQFPSSPTGALLRCIVAAALLPEVSVGHQELSPLRSRSQGRQTDVRSGPRGPPNNATLREIRTRAATNLTHHPHLVDTLYHASPQTPFLTRSGALYRFVTCCNCTLPNISIQQCKAGDRPGDLEIILQSNGGGRPASFQFAQGHHIHRLPGFHKHELNVSPYHPLLVSSPI